MISLGSRFAEYGLTGGFLLFLEAALLVWLFPETSQVRYSIAAEFLAARFGDLPAPAQPAFVSLLAALAIVSIFFAGLLLDLIGSLFVVWEAMLFKKHLDRNEQWFRRFIELTAVHAQSDYDRIQAGFVGFGESARRTFAFLRFWSSHSWRRSFEELKRGFRSIGSVSSFRRLENLLIAHVLIASGTSGCNWLSEQVHLCRASRAISASLFIVALQVSWLGLMAASTEVWTAILWQYAAMGLSLFVTVRAYSRFCDILFSLAYLSGHSPPTPTEA